MARPAPTDLSDFALLMRRRRAELNLTQSDCAAKIGVEPATWLSWESDHRSPSHENRAKIMAALQIDPAKLATVDSVLACVHGWLASGATRSDCAALIAWLGEHRPGSGLNGRKRKAT